MADTIFALATPIGGAIAIIRVSGDDSKKILGKVFDGKIEHSMVSHGKLHDGGEIVDDVMAVFFAAPNSYTGEDSAEIYIHGSYYAANAAMSLLAKSGARPAEAGEFTKRAFLNGKMDISQAEAVADVINASAKRSADSAMMQLVGKLSDEIRSIEDELLNVLAAIDAAIDYPDEVESVDRSGISSIRNKIEKLSDEGMRARHIREGFKIAIIGKPNVGKSSLLNALICEDRAIVTANAGTTRDIIEAKTQFCSLPVVLFDTAGLRDANEEAEKIGTQRAREVAESADLLYIALDASKPLTDDDIAILNDTHGKARIVLLLKADLPKSEIELGDEEIAQVSSKTGEGIDELKRMTAKHICPDDESGLITNSRHVEALKKASAALESAMAAEEIDCCATDIRDSLYALGQITGSTVDSEVIGRIFDRFCVGK